LKPDAEHAQSRVINTECRTTQSVVLSTDNVGRHFSLQYTVKITTDIVGPCDAAMSVTTHLKLPLFPPLSIFVFYSALRYIYYHSCSPLDLLLTTHNPLHATCQTAYLFRYVSSRPSTHHKIVTINVSV